jgi:hypothetical protein
MSVGADKAYDTHDFVQTVREMGFRPHVSQNINRPGGSAIDARTSRHEGYELSQKKRPLIEKVRLDEANCRDAQNEASRSGKGRVAVLDDCSRVQLMAASETSAGRTVTKSGKKRTFSTRDGDQVINHPIVCTGSPTEIGLLTRRDACDALF